MKLIDAVCALTALAQPSRLEVFRLLARQGEMGLCAGDISSRLKIPKPTLSFHLKELNHAGLIYSERDGRSITYYLHVKGMQELMAFLTDNCCQGHPDLCIPTKVKKIPVRIPSRPSRSLAQQEAPEVSTETLPTNLL